MHGAPPLLTHPCKWPNCENFECIPGNPGLSLAQMDAKCNAYKACTGFSYPTGVCPPRRPRPAQGGHGAGRTPSSGHGFTPAPPGLPRNLADV